MGFQKGRTIKLVEDEEDPSTIIYQQVIGRRKARDLIKLQTAKMDAMKILWGRLNEWILEETKDILIFIDALKRTNNSAILPDINPCEARIKKIQRTYFRKIITPMKKFDKVRSESSEEEHCREYRAALDNTFGLIIELRQIRETIDIIYTYMFLRTSSQDEDTTNYIT